MPVVVGGGVGLCFLWACVGAAASVLLCSGLFPTISTHLPACPVRVLRGMSANISNMHWCVLVFFFLLVLCSSQENVVLFGLSGVAVEETSGRLSISFTPSPVQTFSVGASVFWLPLLLLCLLFLCTVSLIFLDVDLVCYWNFFVSWVWVLQILAEGGRLRMPFPSPKTLFASPLTFLSDFPSLCLFISR